MENLTDKDFLDILTGDLRRIEDLLEPLERDKKRIRNQIEPIILRTGKQKSNGLILTFVEGGTTVKYNASELDRLMAKLIATGDIDHMRIATQIGACRTESTGSGSLRIIREKL
jgi:hypothetical protein